MYFYEKQTLKIVKNTKYRHPAINFGIDRFWQRANLSDDYCSPSHACQGGALVHSLALSMLSCADSRIALASHVSPRPGLLTP